MRLWPRPKKSKRPAASQSLKRSQRLRTRASWPRELLPGLAPQSRTPRHWQLSFAKRFWSLTSTVRLRLRDELTHLPSPHHFVPDVLNPMCGCRGRLPRVQPLAVAVRHSVDDGPSNVSGQELTATHRKINYDRISCIQVMRQIGRYGILHKGDYFCVVWRSVRSGGACRIEARRHWTVD